jgi:hypothetical protein
MDRMMVKESRKFNQAKLNVKYRTLSTRQSSQRQPDSHSPTHQTPLPLTFYNLFSHSKYRIVRSNQPTGCVTADDEEHEEAPIRNHILLEVDRQPIKRIPINLG